jgi:hypothetical protein
MVQLSATRCSCVAILCVSLVSFAAITLCVASQRVFSVAVYFVIGSVRKLLVTPSYCDNNSKLIGCRMLPVLSKQWGKTVLSQTRELVVSHDSSGKLFNG